MVYESREVYFLFLLVFSYLLGSVPFGLLIVRLFGGVDPRSAGSGNIGATNVGRTSGKMAGVVTLLLDMLKGALPTAAAIYLFSMAPMYSALTGLAALVGHIFPLYLFFRGGKGVATACGVFLAISPAALLIAAAVFAVVAAIFGYVSLGSIAAALSIPAILYLLGADKWYVIMGVIISALVVIKHWGNIKRLIKGTENSFR